MNDPEDLRELNDGLCLVAIEKGCGCITGASSTAPAIMLDFLRDVLGNGERIVRLAPVAIVREQFGCSHGVTQGQLYVGREEVVPVEACRERDEGRGLQDLQAGL